MIMVLSCRSAFAQSKSYTPGFYKAAYEKQEEKKRSRWTLADWLAQKREMRLMDLWLAKNSYSSPFEFYLDASSVNYSLKKKSEDPHQNYNEQTGEFAAYAGRAGLIGSYMLDEEKRSRWQGALAFRVYGQAIQDTHIHLEWGIQGLSVQSPSQEKFQNQFGAVSMDVYLTKYFGIGGRYSRILPARSNLEQSLEGEAAKARVFIDFWTVQIYGQWNHEQLRTRSPNGNSLETRPGFGGGLRIYF
jgi:hypothetical protein